MKKIITFMLTLAAIFSTTMVASAYEDNDFPSLSSNKHEQFIVELNEENLRADALSDAIQPSHPLSPTSPLAFSLSQHQSFPVS